MALLDPELDVLLATKARLDADPSAEILPAPADKEYFISLKFTGDIEALEQAGLSVGTRVGNVAYGSTDIAGLEALSKLPQVEMIVKMRTNRKGLDESVPEIKANQVWTRSGDNFTGYNGRGVIVGIIDTGIDFTHRAFRKPDASGTTRILKIWDQTLQAQGGETVPGPITHPTISPTATPLGYGVEYSRQQINDTLTSASPAIAVRHVDQDGHGTHVAGIAVGDGSEPGNCSGAYHYIGVATDADILVVRLWGLTEGDTNTPLPANTNAMIDAIRYILLEANNLSQPVALNLSLGRFSSFMDGTSPDCVAIDQLLTDNSTGRAIVFCAGNDADSRFHAKATVPAGTTDTLVITFKIFPDDTKTRNLVIVYSGSNLEVKLQSPVGGANGLINFVTFGNTGTSATANGTGAGSQVAISNTQADRISIRITPPTAGNNRAGVWTLELRDSAGTATSVDAFCLFGSKHDSKSPHFLDHDTSRSTIWEQASGKESIAVGSYRVGGGLAASSSRGMTTDLRLKPEICAPGVNITSAALPQERTDDTCEECCCDCCQDAYKDMSGTSMAAPHVTGIIALMLHKDPTLTHTDIKALLTDNASPKPSDSTLDEDLGWGVGKANAKEVLDHVNPVNPPVTLSAVELPGANQFESLRQRFLETMRGPVLAELLPRHAKEVMALINSNKKVATVWHRCRGPVWIRLALRAAYTPGMPLPVEVEGIRFLEALLRFGEVVKKYASPSFLEDILRYEPELALFEEGMTLEKVIDVFGNRTESPAVISMQSVWDREPVPSERTS